MAQVHGNPQNKLTSFGLAFKSMVTDMIMNTGKGVPANGMLLALWLRLFYKGSPFVRLGLGGMATTLAILRNAVGHYVVCIAAIKRQGLWEPETGPSELMANRNRINEWVYESSMKAGEGKCWAIGPAIVVTHPDCVKHVLKDNFANYEKGTIFKMAFEDLLGDGIFNTNGPRWKTQRKTGVKLFTRRQFGTFINDVFTKHCHTLLTQLSAKGEAEFDIQRLYYKFTLDAIGEIAFGVELHCLETEHVPFADAFDAAQNRILDRLLNPLMVLFPESYQKGLKFVEPAEHITHENFRIMREFGQSVITSRRGSGDAGGRADLLSYFLSHKDEKGQPYEDKYLVDIVLNFIIAGRDTTASTLTWATYRLTRHPEEADKLRQEIDVILQGAEPTFDDIFQRMPLLRAFLNEVLRLHPPVPKDMKSAIADDTLPDGTFVPMHAQILYVPYTMGRMESIWGKDALVFRPGRWLEGERAPSRSDWGGVQRNAIEKDKHGLPRIYAPDAYHAPIFQGGPRTCIGREMAYFEASLVLAMLLQRSVIARASTAPARPAESVTMPVYGGLQVTVRPREDSKPPLQEQAAGAQATASENNAGKEPAGKEPLACPFAKPRL
jgi:cytochrome P450